MKKSLIIILTIVLCSCKEKNAISYSLPSDKDINEIIETIIIFDSIPVQIFKTLPDTIRSKNEPDLIQFPIRHPFSVDLEKLRVFFPEQKDTTMELTPPLPIRGVYIKDLINRGLVDKEEIFTKSDSAYFSFQNDTLKHFTITSVVTKKIYTTTLANQENKEETYFACTIPIFSSDKTNAYVELTYHCYGLCGSANSYILKKVNGKWTIMQRRRLWVA